MPRPRPEWLLVPLYLLPPAGILVFCAYARADHLAAVARTRAGEDPGFDTGDAVGRFRRDARLAPEPGDVDVVWAGARLRFRPAAPVPAAWRFTARFPGGVGPAGLADDAVRLEIERGTAPARLDALDEQARAFRDLYARADLDAIADAPLPLETKAFLVERVPESAAARAFLAALAEAGRPGALGPGVHGPWLGDGARPPLLWPGRRVTEYAWPAPRGHVRLRFGAAGGTPWSGAAPLAGRWSVESVHGGRWWRDTFFRRWIGPAGLAAAGLLLFPALLWLAMRRQRQLDEARVRFVTEIAHDLRTPLTALRLHAELLERDGGDRAARIATEAARLSHLLRNLLDLTRLERGSRVFEPETLPLPELVAEAARDFRALHAGRADDLVVEGPAVSVRADRAALRRCLDNLLDNAGKHTAEGTPVRVSWTGRNGRVLVDVRDEGDGIDRADRPRLFARYHRGARARAAAVPGTGLGLALVRELARGMGGEARYVPSSKGTCFRLELEAAP